VPQYGGALGLHGWHGSGYAQCARPPGRAEAKLARAKGKDHPGEALVSGARSGDFYLPYRATRWWCFFPFPSQELPTTGRSHASCRFGRVRGGDVESLRQAAPLMTYIALAPFLGAEEACAAANGGG